jgi:cytochrome c biogenesis protein CcmG/thiol:disulfide interchange protein DsbE
MNGDAAKRRLWPRAAALGGILLILGLLAYGLTTTGTSTRIDEELAQDRPVDAPDFDLAVLEPGFLPSTLRGPVGRALADGQLQLAELRGTPIVLNFWASWCDPCREEAPRLQEGWGRDSSRGILYLGLNMQDLTDDARAFLDEFAIDYPTIRDPGNEIARRYGATGIPETYFIDRRGRVVGHVIGVLEEETLASGAASAREGAVVLGPLVGGESKPQR